MQLTFSNQAEEVVRCSGYVGRMEEHAQADLAVPEPGVCAISSPLSYSLIYGMMCLLVTHIKVR